MIPLTSISSQPGCPWRVLNREFFSERSPVRALGHLRRKRCRLKADWSHLQSSRSFFLFLSFESKSSVITSLKRNSPHPSLYWVGLDTKAAISVFVYFWAGLLPVLKFLVKSLCFIANHIFIAGMKLSTRPLLSCSCKSKPYSAVLVAGSGTGLVLPFMVAKTIQIFFLVPLAFCFFSPLNSLPSCLKNVYSRLS